MIIIIIMMITCNICMTLPHIPHCPTPHSPAHFPTTCKVHLYMNSQKWTESGLSGTLAPQKTIPSATPPRARVHMPPVLQKPARQGLRQLSLVQPGRRARYAYSPQGVTGQPQMPQLTKLQCIQPPSRPLFMKPPELETTTTPQAPRESATSRANTQPQCRHRPRNSIPTIHTHCNPGLPECISHHTSRYRWGSKPKAVLSSAHNTVDVSPYKILIVEEGQIVWPDTGNRAEHKAVAGQE